VATRGDPGSDLWQDGETLPTTHHTVTGSIQVTLEWRVI